MKKVLLLLMMIVTAISGYSQTKVVDGSWFWFKEYNRKFVTLKDSSDYVVVPMEGFSKKDLFHKMMLGLNNIYEDIDKVVSSVGDDAITVNAYHPIKQSRFKQNGVYYEITGFKCRFSFKFKDGKLRVDAPYVTQFDYHPLLNKEKNLQGNFSDYDGLSGICIAVYDTIERIVDAAYNSSKDDNW